MYIAALITNIDAGLRQKIMLPITRLIKNYIRDNDINQTELAASLNETPQNLYNKLRRSTLTIDYVSQISIVLKHDFFGDYSKVLRKEFINIEASESDKSIGHIEKVSYDEYKALLQENIELYRKIEKLRELIGINAPNGRQKG